MTDQSNSQGEFFQDEAIKFAKAYHFDNGQMDARFDTARVLGRFEGDWKAEVDSIIAQSKPVTFSTRGNTEFTNFDPPKPDDNTEQGSEGEYEAEFFEKVGFGEGYHNYKILNKTNPNRSNIMQKMIDCFAFGSPTQSVIHVQLTGQCFPWHVDIFQNRGLYKSVDKSKLMRVHVLLTDWQPGQWYGYGNYTYTGWKAGDFHTFDLDNVPHYTANASYHPRVSLMVTGMRTDKTDEFLWQAFSNKTVKL